MQRRPRHGNDAAAIRALREIPGVGPSIARNLVDIGIRRVGDLRGKNPRKLYDKSNMFVGSRQDPCLLYVFRCAVYYASRSRHEARLLKWWNWKDNESLDK